MKKFAAAMMATAFVIALGAPAFAKVETVKGVLVDSACYKKDNANTTNAHKGMSETCAQDCAKKGSPVALVTTDGKMYIVTGDLAADKNAKLVPHMSHVMEVTGDVSEGDGKMTIAATDLKMISK
jgi:hypothetical protein